MNSQLIEQAACVVYEAVRGYGLSRGEINVPTWQIVPGEIKSGYRSGVTRIFAGETEPAVIHNKWVEEKTAEGWRYAAEFDPARREAPRLKPFAELTESERRSYELFIAVARVFAPVAKDVK